MMEQVFWEIRSDQEQKIKGIPHFLRQEAWRGPDIYFGLGVRGRERCFDERLFCQVKGQVVKGQVVSWCLWWRNGGRGEWWEFEIVAVENEKRKLIKTSKSIVELSDLMLQAQSGLPQ